MELLKPICIRNLNFIQHDEVLRELSFVQNHDDLSCLVIFVLTHGEKDGHLHAFDDTFCINDIIQNIIPTKCSGLAGKPKLVFVQACQGQGTDSGTMVVGSGYRGSNAEW